MLTSCLAISLHLMPGEWNAIHPCIRYGDDFAVGAYLNSESRVSAYASYTWRHDDWFLEAGAVTGYSGADVLPFARAGLDHNGVKYFIAPGMADGVVGVVLGMEIEVGLQ